MYHFIGYGLSEDELKTILNIRPDYEYRPIINIFYLLIAKCIIVAEKICFKKLIYMDIANIKVL